jgi:hypothetical protein
MGYRRVAPWLLLGVTWLGSVACAADDPEPTAGSAAETPEDAFAAPVCRGPAAAHSPRSISEALEWINAQPKPLSLPCFLETLGRPLALYATESIFSAQPAVGRRSPRMFVFTEPLIMTVTPEGRGSHLLEFGEQRSETTSLKAEIAFPVEAELEPAAPYERLLVESSYTTCSVCHEGEEPDTRTSFTRAFVSRALRPVPLERVSLSELRAEARACDASAEPERCAMLLALFGQGNVVDAEFSAALPTFY